MYLFEHLKLIYFKIFTSIFYYINFIRTEFFSQWLIFLTVLLSIWFLDVLVNWILICRHTVGGRTLFSHCFGPPVPWLFGCECTLAWFPGAHFLVGTSVCSSRIWDPERLCQKLRLLPVRDRQSLLLPLGFKDKPGSSTFTCWPCRFPLPRGAGLLASPSSLALEPWAQET